ncbi:MAG: hypothetical protein MRK02_08680 [Candidatus Scalindua sp.]|nr:hypothetical protein [Candidatus Scalindua sp.]
MKLLDTDNNSAADALDADGDGQPDDLNGDSNYSDEVLGLTEMQTYLAGATFWRTEITHFTPIDANWPVKEPDDAKAPDPDGEPEDDNQKEEGENLCGKTKMNSFVEDSSRIFHEDITIPGTDMPLHYASKRAEGFKILITVPASGNSVPDSLKRIELDHHRIQ